MLLVLPAPTAFAEPRGQDDARRPSEPVVAIVDFERHVAGLFGRLGCNSAACHGSFQGKGGFRLSLFGQSAQKDFEAIVNGKENARIDLESSGESLILIKPTGQETHGGGVRFREDDWEYRLIRRWIDEGARHTPGSGAVAALRIDPGEVPPLVPGQSVRLKVEALFHDGSREDVSSFCEFRSRDDTLVACDPRGILTASFEGDTSIIVSYRGTFASVAVLVPFPRAAEASAPLPPTNLIDEEIEGKADRLGLSLSPRVGDAEFLRRATIDVLGTLPTPDEIRIFCAAGSPEKRARAIDALLSNPRRAALWATKMCDITACNVDTMDGPAELRPKRARMWHDWFRRRFAENMPYDEIVRGVLCATSRGDRPIDEWIDSEIALQESARKGFDSTYAERQTLDLFWRRTGSQGPPPVEDLAELTATAFLGVRLHCARCHQHPFDRWSQHDFAGYAKIFSRVEFGGSTEMRMAMNARLDRRREARREGKPLPELPRVQEVYSSDHPRPLLDAAAEGGAPPKALGGPTFEAEADPRTGLFRWLTAPDNPYFARSFVNRLWARYFGRGLVEPVDAFSPANPPTHPRLLERLSREFIESGYDVRHMERLILSSQAYQRSSVPAGNNAADRHNLVRGTIRPLSAETLIDALNAALETRNDFGPDVPPDSQAIELAPNRFSTAEVNSLFRLLGRGDRRSLCECDRAPGPSLRQPIYLMSDARVLDKVRSGRLARLIRENKTDAEILDELYLATLSRQPDDDERAFLIRHVAEEADRTEALVDIVWALVNTREFVTNH